MDAANEVTFFGRDSLDEFLIAKQEKRVFCFLFFWLLTGINYLNFIVS